MITLMDQTLEWVRSQLPTPEDRERSQVLTDRDRDDAALVARMMASADGQALLELLARATVFRPATDPRLSGAASHDYCQRRTGENAVFGVLVSLMDLHHHLQRKDHDDRNPDPDTGLGPVFGWPDDGLARGGPRDAGSGEAGYHDFDPTGDIAVG